MWALASCVGMVWHCVIIEQVVIIQDVVYCIPSVREQARGIGVQLWL